MATLKVVEGGFGDDRDNVVTLRAPGKPERTEHPMLGPLPVRMKWMQAVHALMRDQGLSLYEADQIVTEGFYASHDGKGRKFQPSALR
jgi:hypothetical protein